MPRGLRHVALSISFISPMTRRPDTLFETNIASLIFLPDLRFLALTSFQSLNRPSLSSGSSSRISSSSNLFRFRSLACDLPETSTDGHVFFLPTILARVLLQRVSMTLPLGFRTASTPNRQCKFYSIPCTKNALSGGPVERACSGSFSTSSAAFACRIMSASPPRT